jgi:hypothetical protein
MWKPIAIVCGCVLCLIGCAAQQEAWQPAQGPLATRWAKDVSPRNALPEYPRPQMVREAWMNLNGLWDYAITPKADPVPQKYDGRILVPYPVESALSGVMKRVDEKSRLWYRRTFETPSKWAGQRILLHFGAVDWETTVWVNGREVGRHQGGYDGFDFDITDALKPSGPQELIVGVWDPTSSGTQPRGKQVLKPEGIWYTPTTGIWQTVWVEPVPKAYISEVRVTPDVDKQEVEVSVSFVGLPLGSPNANNFSYGFEVFDGDRKIAESPMGSSPSVRLKIPNPKLWSPDSPHLYSLRVRTGPRFAVKENWWGDRVESYFGMRKISLGKDEKGITRLMLNNKFVFQNGMLDQGFWPDGLYTAPTDEALRYDIEMTKKLGFNLARKHVKVEPERWYYWCDKLGLLVWQDMPSGDASVGPNRGEITRTADSAKIYEKELKSLIDGRRNHPSIVMWVVFNEGWGQFDTVRLTNWVKQYDPTRLANCASGWNDFPAGDVIDMHNYPGPGSPKPTDTRAAVLGEFGGLGLGVDGHTWAKRTWGYRGMGGANELTSRYVKLLQKAYSLKENPGLSAIVYTQTTDVETEANGMMTYDRALVKGDLEKIAAANRGQFPPAPVVKTLIPTSQHEPQTWQYTTEKPSEGWQKAEFDASAWKTGPGGFGTRGTPGAVVGTEWKTADIWARREFDLPAGNYDGLLLLMHHDEDVEVYLNGVLATRAGGFISDYEEFEMNFEAKAALKPGKNTIAVHCHQTSGGQYIDVGLSIAEFPK